LFDLNNSVETHQVQPCVPVGLEFGNLGLPSHSVWLQNSIPLNEKRALAWSEKNTHQVLCWIILVIYGPSCNIRVLAFNLFYVPYNFGFSTQTNFQVHLVKAKFHYKTVQHFILYNKFLCCNLVDWYSCAIYLLCAFKH